MEYAVLFEKVISNDLCAPLEFRVDQTINSGNTYSTFFTSELHLSDHDFDAIKRIAKAKCEDITFSGKIYNNRDLEFSTNYSESKNGTAITPLTKLGSSSTLSGYRYDDVMQYVLDYITDESVGFADNWYAALDDYGVGPAFEEHIIFKNNDGQDFPISFDTVWNGVSRLYNLGFSLVYDSGNFIFTVDDPSGFYSNTTGLTLSGFTAFNIRINEKNAYTSVKIGGGGVNSFAQRFGDRQHSQNKTYCFGATNLQFKGECNIANNNLDLTTRFAYAGQYRSEEQGFLIALIQRQVAGGAYFGLNAVLNYPISEFVPPAGSNGLGEINPVIANGPASLQNPNVLERYSFLQDVYLSVESNPDYNITVKINPAQNITTIGEFVPIEFKNNVTGASDPRGLWSNSDAEYTTASFNDRIYTFEIDCQVDITVNGFTGTGAMNVYLVYADGSNTYYYEIGGGNASLGSLSVSISDFVITWLGSDTKISVEVIIDATTIDIDVDTTSFLTITQQDGSGDVIIEADPNNVKCYEIDFEAVVSVNDFLAIFRDPRKRIALNLFSEPTKYAWVNDITFTPDTGELKGTLITDWNNLNPE